MLGLSDRRDLRAPSTVPRPLTARGELSRLLRQRTPRLFATPAILALNAAAFAAVAMSSGSVGRFPVAELIEWGALSGVRTIDGEWWRFVTAMFLHGGLAHLAVNMTGLLLVGPTVERLIGAPAFALLYVACGLAGSAASLATHPHVPSVGASGAILGTYGLLLASMIDRPGHVAVAGGAPTIPRGQLGTELRPTLSFIACTLLLGWFQPNVDNAAHVGGLLAGCAIGAVVGRDVEWRRPPATRVALCCAGAIVCCAAAVGVPNRPVDVRPLMTRVLNTDSRIAVLYAEASKQAAGAAAVRRLIETEIVPALAADSEALKTSGRVPAEHAAILRDLRAYVALRETAWRQRAESLAEGRLEPSHRIATLERQADAAMGRLLRARP